MANEVIRSAPTIILEFALKGVNHDIKTCEFVKKQFPGSLMAETADKMLKSAMNTKVLYADELRRR